MREGDRGIPCLGSFSLALMLALGSCDVRAEEGNPPLVPPSKQTRVAFEKLLTASRMVYTLPQGFEEVAPRSNELLPYEWSLYHRASGLEVRLSLRPLKQIRIEYRDPHSAAPEPNHIFSMMYQTILQRISGHGVEAKKQFAKEALASFRADWASAAAEVPNPDYTRKKGLFVLALHANDKADAYVVFLYDDYKKAKPWIKKAFHVLRFEN
ncbi:MAG TPA: hypothetical protein ENK02_03140 [Planctomycetes bacterium]|nr:hypothetical protein [Planctomycetota bacterium]